jgi:hypothetical protein
VREVAVTDAKVLGTHAGCGGRVLYFADRRSGVRTCERCGMSSHSRWVDKVTGRSNAPKSPETEAEVEARQKNEAFWPTKATSIAKAEEKDRKERINARAEILAKMMGSRGPEELFQDVNLCEQFFTIAAEIGATVIVRFDDATVFRVAAKSFPVTVAGVMDAIRLVDSMREKEVGS